MSGKVCWSWISSFCELFWTLPIKKMESDVRVCLYSFAVLMVLCVAGNLGSGCTPRGSEPASDVHAEERKTGSQEETEGESTRVPTPAEQLMAYAYGSEYSAEGGWIRSKNAFWCVNGAGCKRDGMRYRKGDSIKLPRCGGMDAVADMTGFECDKNIWRCMAESCDCMGTRVEKGALCTPEGPYGCRDAYLENTVCHRGESYCGSESLSGKTGTYECNSHFNWRCVGEKCGCGESVCAEGDLCAYGRCITPCSELYDEDMASLCKEDNFNSRYDEGMEKNIVFVESELGKKTFIDEVENWTVHTWEYPGTCHDQYEVYACEGENGCRMPDGRIVPRETIVDAKMYVFDVNGEMRKNPYYFDDLEVYRQQYKQSTREKMGDCVLNPSVDGAPQYALNKDNTFKVCRVRVESFYPEDGEGKELITWDEYVGGRCLEPSERHSENAERVSYDPVVVYDNEKCEGGTFWCRGADNTAMPKPDDTNHGYICTTVRTLPGKDKVGAYKAWVCQNDSCQCHDVSCGKNEACVDGVCIPLDCESWRDGKCLCNGEERPEGGKYTCGLVSPHDQNDHRALIYRDYQWVCVDPDGCQCGDEVCKATVHDGKNKRYGVCSAGKCMYFRYDKPLEPEEFRETTPMCGLDVKPERGDYVCTVKDESDVHREHWYCKGICSCGENTCRNKNYCKDGECFYENVHGEALKVPEGFDPDLVTVIPYDRMVMGMKCAVKGGCVCGEERCSENEACVDGRCLCGGEPLKPGYECNKYERQICADETCQCGQYSCPKNTRCVDGQCVCGTMAFVDSQKISVCVDHHVSNSEDDLDYYPKLSKEMRDAGYKIVGRSKNVLPGSQTQYYYQKIEESLLEQILSGIEMGVYREQQLYMSYLKCQKESCVCGSGTCPENAICLDGSCYCGYTMKPMPGEDRNSYRCEENENGTEVWTSRTLKCGNSICLGQEVLCKNDVCTCGGIPVPGEGYVCDVQKKPSEWKWTYRWKCTLDGGCQCDGKTIPYGSMCVTCDEGYTKQADGCYCGDIKQDNFSDSLCCAGVVIKKWDDLSPYECENAGEPEAMAVCKDRACACGEVFCPLDSACIGGACVQPDTRRPLEVKNGYAVGKTLRVCQNGPCVCQNETCQSGDACILGRCIGNTSPVLPEIMEVHHGLEDYVFMDVFTRGSEILRYPEFSDWFNDGVNLPLDHDLMLYGVLGSLTFEQFCSDLESKYKFGGAVCISPDGCPCYDGVCAEGGYCDREARKCVYNSTSARFRCDDNYIKPKVKDGGVVNEIEPPRDKDISVDDYGNCVCNGTVRNAFVKGYVCANMGWLCKESECECGNVRCKKDSICLKPGMCIE